MKKATKTTTRTRKLSAAGLAMLTASLMVGSTHAADITFNAPVSAMNTSVLDIPWLAGGTFVQGVTYGSGAKSFTTAGGQSISLAGDNSNLGDVDMPAGTPSLSSGWYNAGTQWGGSMLASDTDVLAWTDALKGNLWHDNGSDATRPLTLHLAGLEIGKVYWLSLFSADARFNDRSQAYWSSFSGGTFSGGTSGSFSENPAYMVYGTFTADAVYQDVFIQATDAVGAADTTLAVYTLYAAPVPEPSTFALAGIGLAGLLIFRRRK